MPVAITPETRVGELLDAYPLGLVRQRLKTLAPDRILCIESGFLPAPLIDALSREGYDTFSQSSAADRFRTFFHRAGDRQG